MYGPLSLTAPEKTKMKSFDELDRILHDHISPKPIIIAKQFRFHKLDQHEGMRVNKYESGLKKLSQTCEFGDNLNDTLRDRLVWCVD